MLYRLAYCTSYNKETKCPNWVAWHLTSEHTDGPFPRRGVPYYSDDGSVKGIGHVTQETARNGYFVDLEAKEPRQQLSDWTRDYNMSHGHMCPAGDNKWDETAMYDSFSLVNVCPQNANLNSGLWNSIEIDCRRWARQFGDIYIVCGPVFLNREHETIGENEVFVPEAFFKVVLCLNGIPKALGFIVRNTDGNRKRDLYYNTIDQVERITGIDFFPSLPDDMESEVESHADIEDWR